jgi:hypothetical protein
MLPLAEWQTFLSVQAESSATLVPGFLFSFFSGILNAWILLIEINR